MAANSSKQQGTWKQHNLLCYKLFKQLTKSSRAEFFPFSIRQGQVDQQVQFIEMSAIYKTLQFLIIYIKRVGCAILLFEVCQSQFFLLEKKREIVYKSCTSVI